ncbi:MAG TPA: respiratory nitrate reductase subunit beta [Nitrospirae bacterium]|mgnify:CR=1 FL=1|nr:respiratory nitrate reductase subunit beta [Nitrospirota bacterium]
MSKRQIAMVMDLNKCIGCQTCTMACKTQWTNRNGRDYMYWNNVETAPGKGYPRGWQESGGGFNDEGELKEGRIPSLTEDYGKPLEINYEEALGIGPDGPSTPWTGVTRPHLKPEDEKFTTPNWDEDEGEGEFPNSFFFYLPRICNHCSNPACLASCPRKAIYKREEDGIVLVDQSRCRGYQHCVAGCPYKKVYFNPMFSRSEKCIFCYPRVEQGKPPACAKQCPGRIRFVGYLDDEASPVYALVKKWKVAVPLRPDFGTQPNVYYVPPLSPPKYDEQGRLTDKPRIPIKLLTGLFGPETPRILETLKIEREKKKRGEPSELMDTLIAYRHDEMFTITDEEEQGF